MDNQEIKTRIRNLRMKFGYTQQGIADSLDIHVNTYSTLENGDKPIVSKYIDMLADIFGCTTEELLLGYKPVNPKQLTEGMVQYSHEAELRQEIRLQEMTITNCKSEIKNLKNIIHMKDMNIVFLEKLFKDGTDASKTIKQFGKEYVSLLDKINEDNLLDETKGHNTSEFLPDSKD